MLICEHLKPILQHELDRKNKIEQNTDWGSIVVFIFMAKPMDVSFERENFVLESFVKYHENRSPHYMFKGFYCDRCKHTIVGPID